MSDSVTLTDILSELEDKAGQEALSLGEIVDSFQDRGFGALLFIFSFIIFLPTGMIPGLAAVCAIFIVLLSAQILLGRHSIWVPEHLRDYDVKQSTIHKAVSKASPAAQWIDRQTKPRIPFFLSYSFIVCVALISLILGLITIPLSFIPGAGSITSAPILFFALGLMAKDGLIMAVGLGITLLAMVLLFLWF